uniref:Phospholipid scramblase n=1 Tax=Romanomermis culicivorax TaxID=13658 RepID=A0A915JGP4_ROMCU
MYPHNYNMGATVQGQFGRGVPPGGRSMAPGAMAGVGLPMMAGGNINALLAPLYGLDRAIVQQQVEPLEVFTGIETNNRYVIFNTMGQPIYYAYEETHPFALAYMGKNRPFTIRMIDGFGQQIMMVNSSVATLSRQVMVQIPVGRPMAVIQTEFGSFIPSFFVNDLYGRMMFTIRSPMNALNGGMAALVNFHVLSGDQMSMVGMISKTYDGMFRALYTDADTFWVSFPPTMDPSMKAMLIAATFVVDFTFYEN